MVTQVASDLYIFTSQRHVAWVTAGWWLSQDLGLGPTLNSDNTGSAQPLAPAPTSAVTVMKTPSLVTLQSSSEVSHFSDCDCSVGSTSANVEDIGRDFQCGTAEREIWGQIWNPKLSECNIWFYWNYNFNVTRNLITVLVLWTMDSS